VPLGVHGNPFTEEAIKHDIIDMTAVMIAGFRPITGSTTPRTEVRNCLILGYIA
jgi:hypothetical protein